MTNSCTETMAHSSAGTGAEQAPARKHCAGTDRPCERRPRKHPGRSVRAASAGAGNARGGWLSPPAPHVPVPRRTTAATGFLLGRSVLELLQRADLHLDGGRLGGEPLLFLGERVDALAARL